MTPTVIPAIFRAKDEMSKTIASMRLNLSTFSSKFSQAGKSAFAVGRTAAVAGAMIIAPLVISAKAAVDFEEKMSDVGKTTGMQGDKLTKFGEDLLSMSTKTRTSIDDLASIAEIGGQLGIAEKDLMGFTKSANDFNIALGKDFSGGVEEAVSTVGKIKTLFAETRDLNIADAISKTGSAINELGAVGAATSANISDFTLRMGALPDSLKMTAQNTLALGTYLEEMGIDSQIAAGGMSNLLLVAGREVGGFAKQMGISSQEAKTLLEQDPSKFASKFAATFKGMAPDKMAKSLEGLKIGSQETIKILGALSSDQVNQATGLTRLATLQNVSNKAFAENNSLKSEAAKKEQTAAAQMAKLKNNMQALAITIGNALLPVINSLVETLSPYIQAAGKWIQNNKGLATTIVKVAAVVGGLAFAISGVSFAVGIYQKAMVVAQAAQKLMNLTMLATPWGIAIAAVAGLAVGAYALSKAFGSVSTAQEINNEVKDRALEKTLDERAELSMLFTQLRNNKQGTEGYTTALSALDAKYPGIIEKYDMAHASLSKLNAIEKELAGNIIKRATAEAKKEMLKETIMANMRSQQEGPSTANQLLGLVGGGTGGFALHFKDLQEQQKRIDVLASGVAQDQMQAANPEEAKRQAKEGKQIVEFTFNGLPDWMKPTVSKSGAGSMPVMGKNL